MFSLEVMHVRRYDDFVQTDELDIKKKNRILLSRNGPVALVLGVSGFIGSHVCDLLLSRDIQVIGVDDFSLGKKNNLAGAIKSKNFHLIDADMSVENEIKNFLSDLPRLDYVFFATSNYQSNNCYEKGMDNLFALIEELSAKPKLLFVSSIELYEDTTEETLASLKKGEIKFAKTVKEKKINARVVRLADVYGPRMHFREKSAIGKLIFARLKSKHEGSATDEYSSRSIFIDDAINLLMKALLGSGTVNKIYDGAEIKPFKISQIKEVLIDPQWHKKKDFKTEEIPPWPTPNLKRTIKELSWKPRTSLVDGLGQTLDFFNVLEQDQLEKYLTTQQKKQKMVLTPFSEKTQPWSLKSTSIEKKMENEKKLTPEPLKEKKSNSFLSKMLLFTLSFLIVYALIFPPLWTIFNTFYLNQHINSVNNLLKKGEFDQSKVELNLAWDNLTQIKLNQDSITAIGGLGIFTKQTEKVKNLIGIGEAGLKSLDEAISGLNYFKIGLDSYLQPETDHSQQKEEFNLANYFLNLAANDTSYVTARLDDINSSGFLPDAVSTELKRAGEEMKKLNQTLEGSRELSKMLTSIKGEKNYLVIILDNKQLRPVGGKIAEIGILKIGKSGKLQFETKNLEQDSSLTLKPPADILGDFGANALQVNDIGIEPDFPTVANALILLMQNNGEKVDGVIGINKDAWSKFLAILGKNGELEMAEVITDVNELPKDKWFNFLTVFIDSLGSKEIVLFDPEQAISEILMRNHWSGQYSGTLPFEEGDAQDGFAIFETNIDGIQENLDRNVKIETTIDENGGVTDKLETHFLNSEDLKVRERVRIYLPLGSKVKSASFNEQDYLNRLSVFVEHNQAIYSVLLEFNPKTESILKLDYELPKGVVFKDGVSGYQLNFIKQSGVVNYPINWKVVAPDAFQINNQSSANFVYQAILSNIAGPQITLSR